MSLRRQNMKVKIRSRITAILAAVLLVFAMMPMTASAEGAAEGHAGQSGWTEWTGTTSLPDRAGKYYLKGDVTLDITWSVPNGETALCLNGKTINSTLADRCDQYADSFK